MAIKLSYEQIKEKADQLKSASTTMSDLLTQVDNLFKTVGDESTWGGTAAEGVKQSFDTLKQKFPEFSAAVNECYTYLYSVVANYQAIDAAASSQQQ